MSLRIAIVGYGFMGRTHYGAWKKCPGAKVVAVCDANLSQLTTTVVGNLKGAADNSRLPASIRVWRDFDAMLASGGFDAVDITLPTALHAESAVKALRAGFHVLCEKPMALTVRDCNRMLVEARRTRRTLLVAQCVRFFPEYAYLRRLVQENRYGKVIAADFTRFMSAPKWSPSGGGWLLDETKSGGLYVDAHIHDADYILSVFGAPRCVRSRAHRSVHGYVDHLTTDYVYDDGKIVTADCSFAAANALVWDAAVRVFFERATVFIGPAYRHPLTIYPNEGHPFSPKLSQRTGYEEEVRYFRHLVEGTLRAEERILTAEAARDSLALVLRERTCAARQI